MNYTHNNSIIGLPQGLWMGQYDRLDEINERIESRNQSDIPLQPNFDPRPVPTKYSLFPIIERRTIPKEQIHDTANYSTTQYFSPANRPGPVSTYFRNIDTEIQLRNQVFALQHGAEQSVYVPSSQSDLYHVSVPISHHGPQTHPLLFENHPYKTTLPDILASKSEIGRNQLFNHTRTQLRSL